MTISDWYPPSTVNTHHDMTVLMYTTADQVVHNIIVVTQKQ